MSKVIELQKIIGKGYKQFWESKLRYRMVKGGRGSKKSTTQSLWVITNMMKYNNSNTLVVRKIFKDHKDSTYAQLNWAVNRLGVSHLWHSKLSPLEMIYIPTGQKILFRGLDDPMSITSITVEHGYLCWVWFEEFYQINNENDFNMVDMSVRGLVPEPLFKQITGTFNPWNEKHWIKKRFFDEDSDNTLAMTTTYECNEFLGDDDRKLFNEMKEKNPRRYNVEGLGNWGIAEGLIYDNWEEKDFDINQLLRSNPRLETASGLDFGYTADPTAYVGLAIDFMYKEIWIYDEHYQKGMLNSDIATMLRYKGLSKSEIIADSAEPKSIDEIKLLGIERIKPARKGKDSVLNGIQFLQQFKIYVHKNCVNTILEFNNYSWDTKDGKQLNKPIDDFNHLMDAIRYAVEKYIGGKKELKAVSALY